MWSLIALNRLILNRAVSACLELTTCLVTALCWLLPLVLQYNWLRDGRLWREVMHGVAICSAGVERAVLGFDMNRMISPVDVSLSVVFQRNSGPAAWGFSPVPERAAHRSGHTRHLQVHTIIVIYLYTVYYHSVNQLCDISFVPFST